MLFICLISLFILKDKDGEALNFKDKTNIQYSSKSDRLLMDISYPEVKSSKKQPAVIYVHGGSYANGDKERYKSENMKYFKNSKYIYISINYRLNNEAVFPAAINDVKSAIRYVKSNSDELNVDTDNIFLFGHSAGANLVSLVSATEGLESLNKESIEYPKYKSDVKGLILTSGFYNLDTLYSQLKGRGRQKVYNNIKYQFKDTNHKKYSIDSLNSYLKRIDKPTLIFHNTGDTLVSHQQSIDYYNTLKIGNNENDNIDLVLKQAATHSGATLFDENTSIHLKEWMNNIIE